MVARGGFSAVPGHDRYRPSYVLAPHNDGSWRRATLLSQHRVDGVWRVTVGYTVNGLAYWRGMPASECGGCRRPSAGDAGVRVPAAAG